MHCTYVPGADSPDADAMEGSAGPSSATANTCRSAMKETVRKSILPGLFHDLNYNGYKEGTGVNNQ
jgi:hypothetical protein